MEELCAKSADDDTDLQEKIARFLEDRNIDTVTGIRRMGRDNLVDYVASKSNDSGRTCSIFPDISSNDIIIFRQWHGLEDDMRELRARKPSLDILFGQDLCHQVPAVVRYK
ncbi:MAG: hypothetical protein E7Z65_08310 [Thermoplasmata archaeon]|nr:hypothetical protein [Thermoplasmata archaeon]